MTHTMSEVMHAYMPALRVWARKWSATLAQQEDLVQLTLIRAYRRWETFDANRGSYDSWLFVMMRSLAIDMYRKEKALTRALARASVLIEETSVQIDDESLDRIQRDLRLHACLLKLPEPQRKVLHMYFFEDKTDAEISRTLNIALGTIKSRKRYGLIALKAMFGMK